MEDNLKKMKIKLQVKFRERWSFEKASLWSTTGHRTGRSTAHFPKVSKHDAIQSNIKYGNVRVTGAFRPRVIGIWP